MSDLQTRADQLYTALFGTWKGPKRASRMTAAQSRTANTLTSRPIASVVRTLPNTSSDIRAQLRTIPRSRKGEDYPSGNPVRLPFGYHKLKRTRGVLVLQDGRRFRLDNPEQRCSSLHPYHQLSISPNPKAVHGKTDRSR